MNYFTHCFQVFSSCFCRTIFSLLLCFWTLDLVFLRFSCVRLSYPKWPSTPRKHPACLGCAGTSFSDESDPLDPLQIPWHAIILHAHSQQFWLCCCCFITEMKETLEISAQPDVGCQHSPAGSPLPQFITAASLGNTKGVTSLCTQRVPSSLSPSLVPLLPRLVALSTPSRPFTASPVDLSFAFLFLLQTPQCYSISVHALHICFIKIVS